MGKILDRKEAPTAVPPLVSGDRLMLKEYLRRYEASPEGVRAELINGVVYVNSEADEHPTGGSMPPISLEGHSVPQSKIHHWLESYVIYTFGVQTGAPATLVLPTGRTVSEPDAFLRILPEFGGSTVDEGDDYLHGSPELLVEVARSSAGLDLGPKLQEYSQAGIKEYLVWRTRPNRIEWLKISKLKKAVPIEPDVTGIVRSTVFPGLWLDTVAMCARDSAGVLRTLQLGLDSPEHAAFVAKLQAKAKRK